MAISEVKNSIVIENDRARITLSKKNAMIEEIIDKSTGKNIKGEDWCFFPVLDENRNCTPCEEISLKGDIVTVKTDKGSYDVKVIADPDYFEFNLLTEIPEGIHGIRLANAKFDYDHTDKKGVCANGVALTYWANPVYFPTGNEKETLGEVFPHLRDKGARFAIVISPRPEMREIIKKAVMTVDKNTGIRNTRGGAWSVDSRLNFGNNFFAHESTPEFIAENVPFYVELGVDQVNFHHGGGTFRQGDFKMERYASAAEFKKNVSDVLEANGVYANMHTYSFYIRPDCETLLADPKWQKDLGTLEVFTLAEDITADTEYIMTEEPNDCISMDRGFCVSNSYFMLVDNELISFDRDWKGIKVTGRGCTGTKAVDHKKGALVKHLDGHYAGIAPVRGSELFLEVARLTAKTYNEAGFKMIYFDALDGIAYHGNKKDGWYYSAMFLCEVLKYCEVDPVVEGATFYPSFWNARGRAGAWDTPYRGYRGWNERHRKSNLTYIDCFCPPMFGWYDFYPLTEKYPGNEHTKYHHFDSIEHVSAIALMHDFSTSFESSLPRYMKRFAAMKRNMDIFRKYDTLRKEQYFAEEYRQKLIDCPYEVQLKEKRGGKYTFVEKDYQYKRLYDLNDAERNKAEYKNPFGAQVPFIRIEAFLSTAGKNPSVLLPLDENKELTAQKLYCRYGGEINYADKLAKKVRVFGNGKNGAIRINSRCATNSEMGHGEYIIDVNFEGWREFIFIESDNGERPDRAFPDQGNYAIFRSGLNHDRTTGIDIDTLGDMTGVRMSSITACEHVYDMLKNPTLKVGDQVVTFECELKSTDFIEFDGKEAKVLDRYGNERPIWFSGSIKVPRGKFTAELTAKSLNRMTPRAQVTFGFTGKEIK